MRAKIAPQYSIRSIVRGKPYTADILRKIEICIAFLSDKVTGLPRVSISRRIMFSRVITSSRIVPPSLRVIPSTCSHYNVDVRPCQGLDRWFRMHQERGQSAPLLVLHLTKQIAQEVGCNCRVHIVRPRRKGTDSPQRYATYNRKAILLPFRRLHRFHTGRNIGENPRRCIRSIRRTRCHAQRSNRGGTHLNRMGQTPQRHR